MNTVFLRVSGMSCANCSSRLERVLNRIDGVSARVDFASERAHVTLSKAVTQDTVIAAVRKAGFDAEDEAARGYVHSKPRAETSTVVKLVALLICILPFVASMLAMPTGRHDLIPQSLLILLATIVQFYFGRAFYRGAWASLRGGDANMDVLVVLSTTVTYALSLWNFFKGARYALYLENSVFIIFFVTLGKWFETRAKANASSELETLLKEQPSLVRIEKDGALIDQPVSRLQVGDIFILKPGDNIVADGDVVEGESEVDESLLTGEAHPAYRKTGDKVFAATTNLNGVLRVRALAVASGTVVSQMAHVIKNAQLSGAHTSKLVDKISRIFVPAILIIAIFVYCIWWLVTGSAQIGLLPALSVLVVACPCALGLATPTVFLVANGLAARAGILLRNVSVLEQICKIDTFLFDKTGTLTRGQFNVTDVVPAPSVARRLLLQTLVNAESNMAHPLAIAITNYARSQGFTAEAVLQNISLPGRGVALRCAGVETNVGAPAYLAECGVTLPSQEIRGLEAKGKTVVVVARDKHYIGLIALEDIARQDAKPTIESLRGLHIESHMLTGDNAVTAQMISAETGIQNFQAGVLPEGKADFVSALRREGRTVAMVGDGVNDAQALASAHVSFAMGSAAGIAMNHADIILLRNRLGAILDIMQLGRAARSKIRSNLFLAFLYNCCAIPLAALGFLTPATAAAAMALSSISVVLNALLLKQWRPSP